MDPHLEDPAPHAVSLPDEVRRVAATLLDLLDGAALGRTAAGATVRAACEAVSRRLLEPRLTLALVGDAGAGRRTLLNALLGDRVISTAARRRGSTITIVRSRPSVDFAARSLDGRTVAELSRKVPDRRALLEKSMAQIDRDRAATEELMGRLQSARERAAARHTSRGEPAVGERGPGGQAASQIARPLRRMTLLWHALWSWIVGLIFSLPWIKRLPREPIGGERAQQAAPPEPHAVSPAAPLEEEDAAVAALEKQLAGMPGLAPIDARAQRLRLEWDRYESERRSAFLSQVHDFDGTDVGERIIEYPARHLPEGLTLIDLPSLGAVDAPAVERLRTRVAREVDALVVVLDMAQPPGDGAASVVRALSEGVPVAFVVLTKADLLLKAGPAGASDGVPARIERLRREAIDRFASALDANVRRAPCIAVAAEASLETRSVSSPLAEHFAETMRALAERLDRERPSLLASREAMRLRMGITELSRALARERESTQKRLSALEGKRFPDPDQFRGRLMGRVDGAIEKGADDVLAAAVEDLHATMEGLRSEWTRQIASCTGRSELDARIAELNEGAARRISEALEHTAELVARELHAVTETLEVWAVDEIRAQYQLVQQLGAEAFAPVASELTRDDLERELQAMQPFGAALEAFEKGRVGYGLGGVAGGALIGTLIAPGIGTAVGAMLGVFAGLLKGTDSLKQDCIARIEAWTSDAEGHARAQLQDKRPDLSRVIRVSLDEALAEAIEQLSGAIARLLAIESRAIDGERTKLEKAAAAGHTLEECGERLSSRAS